MRELAPPGDRSSEPPRGPGQALTPVHVTRLALGLVVCQLLLRAYVAARGNFYWDDLILTGRAGSLPLWSSDFLLYDHDGHFMPAAFLTAGLVTRLAPLQWALPVVSLVLLQAVASLAVLRLMVLVLGRRPVVLVPLLVYLFSPLTLPSFAWWAAALNALPLQAGLAWVAGDAVQLVRTGRLRYAISGTVVFALSLTFFEKAVLIPWVALAVVLLLLRVEGAPRPSWTVARRGIVLWGAAATITIAWAWAYAAVVSSPAQESGGTASQAAELVQRSFSLALLPALLGGPWSWDRLLPSAPYATPPAVLVVLGWIALLAALWATLRWKRRVGWVWVFVAAYVWACVGVMLVGRLGEHTPVQLPQTLRYLADSAVVIAVGVALVLRAPDRAGRAGRAGRRPGAGRTRRLVVVSAAALFVLSSLWSTATFSRMWSDYPTAGYLANARASLAAHSDIPLLDQPIAQIVLSPLANPNNLAAQVFSPLRDRPRFSRVTPVLRLIDDSGHVVDARVEPGRTIRQGPVPRCGFRVTGRDATVLPLDGPLFDWEWTVQLNYLSDRDGSLAVAIGSGRPVRTPVVRGLHQVFIRASGGGTALRVTSRTPGLTACIGSGPVGLVKLAS
ncbi:MAG: hypothetical protein ACXV4A_11295 [Actinomycetes bacterium]